MQAYVFYEPNSAIREQIIRDYANVLHISPFDCITIQSENPSIGIAETRMFIKSLSLAPQNGEFTAGILHNAHLLTAEAQQSLLKTLEEPPTHAYIFLGAEHDQQLIPTIRSRCITITRPGTRPEINADERSAVKTILSQILPACAGEKIRLIQGIGKSKEEMNHWIDIALDILREDIVKDTLQVHDSHKTLQLIHRLLTAKKYLVNNIQPLLLVEHAML